MKGAVGGLALIVLLLSTGCASLPPATGGDTTSAVLPPFEILRHRQDRKIAEGVDTLVIDNPYGEIQVRQTGAYALAVQAIEQRIGEKPQGAALQWFTNGRRQGLEVRYPGRDPRRSADPRRGRVDLVVFVPPRLTLDIRGGFGDIIVRRVDNEVKATSATGSITIAARGSVEARSRRGVIRVYPMEARPGLRYRVVTGGEVYAEVPLDAPLELTVEASAALLTDLCFDRRVRKGRGERAELRVGTAEIPFSLRGRKVVLIPFAATVPRLCTAIPKHLPPA